MYKVFVVDDEPIIRKGLINVVEWNNYDCEVCGEASDGLLAIDQIIQIKPDILFTDIRMPEMDGIQLVKKVKKHIPNSKIIIITGFKDFEYARDALKFGVFDFLLKPTKLEDINFVIERAVLELKEKKDQLVEFEKLKYLFDQNKPILREKFLLDVLYGGINKNEDIKTKLELFNISINKFYFILVENEFEWSSDINNLNINKHLFQFGVVSNFVELFDEKYKIQNISISSDLNGFIIQCEEELEEEITSKFISLQSIIKKNYNFSISIAISSFGKDIYELEKKYKEANEALKYKIYIGSNSIIFHKDISGFLKFDKLSNNDKLQTKLIEAIESGDIKVVKDLLDDINTIFSKEINNDSISYIKNYYFSLLSSIENIRFFVSNENNNKTNEKIGLEYFYEKIEKSKSIQEMNKFLKDVSLKIATQINMYNKKSMKLIIQKAVNYIESHYFEQVTLNKVAENIYVSSCHLSRMFKKELGKNFIDYLNEIRIEKAKILLKDLKYKSFEVADMVGISDAQYFSKLFKKYTNYTPTEYREKILK